MFPRFLLASVAAAAVFLLATAALAQGDLGADIGSVVDAARAGQWILFASAIVTVLLQLVKQPWLGGLWQKVPPRVRVIVPIVLGAAAAVLASIAGGVPWLEALIVGLFTGPIAVFNNEAFVKALFGKKTPQ